jgi:hypothetical protein
MVACVVAPPNRSGPHDSAEQASTPGATTTIEGHVGPLPGHSTCLPPGQAMSDGVCLAVVEQDGRMPGTSYDRSFATHDDPDPRLVDPELDWLTSQIRRCTCSCCHQSELGGPGSYFWDLDYDGPGHWIDTASDWSLGVFVGTYEGNDQKFPNEDLARVRAVIEAELERRDAARERTP